MVLNSDGTYTYTPDADFNGIDSFTYEVCNDETPQECTTATVTITVQPLNDTIFAEDDVADVDEDGILNGTTVLNTIALLNNAKILRVHDVKQAKELINLVTFMRAEKDDGTKH